MGSVSRTTHEQVSALLFDRGESLASGTKVLIKLPPTVLITRGLAEMTRIGVAYGASPLTFLSLAGVGDLFLTCSSPTSRNYTVGYRMGKGEKLEDILPTLGSVAEGVTTAKGVKKIIDELGVTAPIAIGVSDICHAALRLSAWDTHLIVRVVIMIRYTKCCMKVSVLASQLQAG